MARTETPSWRTLLVLGRVSNLPTVWTNCLAGWGLGGGGDSWWPLLRLCLGASLVYVGGMYLNDAFDAEFDRQYRRQRPIPSGAIREDLVWKIGWSLLLAGTVSLSLMGLTTAIFAVLLAGVVVLYDALHKALSLSPLLMASCRFLLYPLAASVGTLGVTGHAVWAGFALAGWVVGLSYVAKRESTTGRLQRWPLVVLSLPLVFAGLYNSGDYRLYSLGVGFLVAAWAVWCLRHTFAPGGRNLGLTVSGLLAGICLVDWLALLPNPFFASLFVLAFVASLLAQRFIPAT
jgi:hypothetical protein